ncbi:VOC family protein [Bacillus taeanensis]|uniref:VOC family protein n=1 Tax=Bacillus taeanensis TaxID=273032 RepID=A0A366XWZ3_9BACI|nr:VOC family protein [Bacillus taeanensis]RBW70662.1 VOC family protein [Bacillus taeanensis]
MTVKKIEHVGIMVRDINMSIAFYEQAIGLRLLNTLTHNDPSIKLAFLGFHEEDETVIELIQGYNDKLPSEGKVHHIAFTVENIEAEIARLNGLKVTFIDNEITTLPNGDRYIFFEGLDGEWIEFYEPALT